MFSCTLVSASFPEYRVVCTWVYLSFTILMHCDFCLRKVRNTIAEKCKNHLVSCMTLCSNLFPSCPSFFLTDHSLPPISLCFPLPAPIEPSTLKHSPRSRRPSPLIPAPIELSPLMHSARSRRPSSLILPTQHATRHEQHTCRLQPSPPPPPPASTCL